MNTDKIINDELKKILKSHHDIIEKRDVFQVPLTHNSLVCELSLSYNMKLLGCTLTSSRHRDTIYQILSFDANDLRLIRYTQHARKIYITDTYPSIG